MYVSVLDSELEINDLYLYLSVSVHKYLEAFIKVA